MRAKIVEADLIEAVIGLGPNLFYNSPMEACIVICRAQKPPQRRGKILFINARNEVTREQAQSFLAPNQIDKIVNTYGRYENVEGFAREATLDEIRSNVSNLNITLYVRQSTEGRDGLAERLLTEVVADWLRDSAELRSSLRDLLAVLEEIQAGDA